MDIERLFHDHHASLLRYLLRLTGDLDTAQDAAQEAFVRMAERPPRGDQPRAWLFTVATNVVRKRANTRRRRLALLESAPARVPAPQAPADPAALFEASERRRRVRAALDQLTLRERTVLLMREEGFTHREIAVAVGTTTGSVGTLIARSLDRLAIQLSMDLNACEERP
jgi:RNA polymerase sigma factor (sigma-70 family)